jgi:putative transposase
MPRTPRRRQWTEAACYHVMNRGHNRETVFADADDCRHFLQLLSRYRERFGLRLYHYCLMGNHFHLLLQVPEPARLSAFVAGLLRSYVHYFHRRYHFVGHLWQGRFKSPAVETETYLLSCGRHIERNPLAARLAGEPWQYPWSSCRAYALGEPDPLLAENPWYQELAAKEAARRQRWREFLLAEDPREPVVCRDDWVLGGDAFQRATQALQGRPVPRRRGRPSQSAAETAGAFIPQPTEAHQVQ